MVHKNWSSSNGGEVVVQNRFSIPPFDLHTIKNCLQVSQLCLPFVRYFAETLLMKIFFEILLVNTFCWNFIGEYILLKLYWWIYFVETWLMKIFCWNLIGENVFLKFFLRKYFVETLLVKIFCWNFIGEDILWKLYWWRYFVETLLVRIFWRNFIVQLAQLTLLHQSTALARSRLFSAPILVISRILFEF